MTATLASTTPATHLNTQVGEWIHVEYSAASWARGAAFDAEVLGVEFDEHGTYFNVEWDDYDAEVRWASIPNTITCTITKTQEPSGV